MLLSEICLYEMAITVPISKTGLPCDIWMSGKDASSGGVQIKHGPRLKIKVNNGWIPISLTGDLDVEDGYTISGDLHTQVKHFIRLNMSILHQRWENLINDQQFIKHIRKLPEIGWEQADNFKEKRRQDHLKYLQTINKQK